MHAHVPSFGRALRRTTANNCVVTLGIFRPSNDAPTYPRRCLLSTEAPVDCISANLPATRAFRSSSAAVFLMHDGHRRLCCRRPCEGFCSRNRDSRGTRGNRIIRGAPVAADLWQRIIRDGLSEHVWRHAEFKCRSCEWFAGSEPHLTKLQRKVASAPRRSSCRDSPSNLLRLRRGAVTRTGDFDAARARSSGARPDRYPSWRYSGHREPDHGSARAKSHQDQRTDERRPPRRKVDRSTLIEVESIRRLARPPSS